MKKIQVRSSQLISAIAIITSIIASSYIDCEAAPKRKLAYGLSESQNNEEAVKEKVESIAAILTQQKLLNETTIANTALTEEVEKVKTEVTLTKQISEFAELVNKSYPDYNAELIAELKTSAQSALAENEINPLIDKIAQETLDNLKISADELKILVKENHDILLDIIDEKLELQSKLTISNFSDSSHNLQQALATYLTNIKAKSSEEIADETTKLQSKQTAVHKALFDYYKNRIEPGYTTKITNKIVEIITEVVSGQIKQVELKLNGATKYAPPKK